MDRRHLRHLARTLTINIALAPLIGCAALLGSPEEPPPTAPPPEITAERPPPRVALEGTELPGGLPEGPPELAPVYFPRDSSDLDAGARSTLQRHARMLMDPARPMPVRVEGHCDATGTNEYNLVLGERRARAVRDYLVDLGVDPGHLATRSYGEELPVAEGEDEHSRRLNRRAELRPASAHTTQSPIQSPSTGLAPTARKSAPAGR